MCDSSRRSARSQPQMQSSAHALAPATAAPRELTDDRAAKSPASVQSSVRHAPSETKPSPPTQRNSVRATSTPHAPPKLSGSSRRQ